MRFALTLLLALVIAAAQSLPAAAMHEDDFSPAQTVLAAGAQMADAVCEVSSPPKPASLAYKQCAKGQAKHGMLPCDPVRGVLAEANLRLPPDIRQDVEHQKLPRMRASNFDTFLRPPRLRS